MIRDPEYLDHLGELATLKNAIACYFHADAGLEFRDVEAAWKACLRSHGYPERELVVSQIGEVLKLSDHEILVFWRRWADWGFLPDAAAVRAGLERARDLFANPEVANDA
jgi:hypothetical protein